LADAEIGSTQIGTIIFNFPDFPSWFCISLNKKRSHSLIVPNVNLFTKTFPSLVAESELIHIVVVWISEDLEKSVVFIADSSSGSSSVGHSEGGLSTLSDVALIACAPTVVKAMRIGGTCTSQLETLLGVSDDTRTRVTIFLDGECKSYKQNAGD